ncbi:hypothetical protein [Mesorhizobium sp.]|uniref:hypothetical protein n=1 Tax=Mesorhizobium sp. TaxID=1871066 RepID=UPI0025BF66D4|nr:hypothetical protein [Mesorhizobium sp.]
MERGRNEIEQRNSTYNVANSGLTEIIMALLADGLDPEGIGQAGRLLHNAGLSDHLSRL